jgi:glycerophosphoryl diester phosphodiesterase
MIKIFSALAVFLLMSLSTNAGEPLIVAHRGASKDAPANTIPAFQLAWEQGADAIEADFHLSKDGEIVCIHDVETKKVAGTNLIVRNSTLAELKQLDVGAIHGEAFKGTTIPTLAEVFATIPENKKIYIEVKCGAAIVPVLLNEIDQSGLTKDQIVVISFNQEVIQQLKIQAPHYKASWLCSFKKQETGEITPSLDTVLKTLKAIEADGLSSNTAVPVSVIEAIGQQGYEWHAWTINNLKAARRMQAMGALSITTDVPGVMRQNLISVELQ